MYIYIKRQQQIRRDMGIPACDATNPNFSVVAFVCVIVYC